ncbi:type II toxin-antitoxin system Phd/YefM family antitoxin [Streptococcus dysgalactiae]|uniref:type II toxin-antitoxin system Phd/YefM family antitoxin n=2 Tax=Streptococcus TaxID=1301 RepID=UPI0012A7B364|nr:type II toxin-antitoxin system Phd/YefM family antitoxin [Streptococcus dysgalactiae]QGH03461.1 type II toxin-antitoxin system Phd/YefM family antitoxin [Streptococcus dysgalactiae subsp. dysgalactiae]
MENIVPVSDMRYYNQTLSDVSVGSQVILTRNGKAEYAVVDIEEWRRTKATLRLFEELQKGYRSLANEKTYTPDELAERLGWTDELQSDNFE